MCMGSKGSAFEAAMQEMIREAQQEQRQAEQAAADRLAAEHSKTEQEVFV